MNYLIVAETNLDFEAKDVTAGFWGLLLFLAMIGLLVFLFFSFTKHVRRARQPWEGEETADDAVDGDVRDAGAGASESAGAGDDADSDTPPSPTSPRP